MNFKKILRKNLTPINKQKCTKKYCSTLTLKDTFLEKPQGRGQIDLTPNVFVVKTWWKFTHKNRIFRPTVLLLRGFLFCLTRHLNKWKQISFFTWSIGLMFYDHLLKKLPNHLHLLDGIWYFQQTWVKGSYPKIDGPFSTEKGEESKINVFTKVKSFFWFYHSIFEFLDKKFAAESFESQQRANKGMVAVPRNSQTYWNNSSANCRRIVWVCLTILRGWRLKGSIL